MNNDNWKPILLVGGGCGGLIGLWTGLWIAGFLVLWEKGMLHPGVAIRPEYSDFLRMNSDDALSIVGAYLHLDLPTHPLTFLFLITFVAAAIGSVVASVSRLVSLDPESIGFRSFRWALRSMVFWPASLLSIASIALLFITISNDDIFLMATVLVIAFVAIPISLCQPAVVAGRFANRWWRLRWPGLSAVGIFLAIEIFEKGADFLRYQAMSGWIMVQALALVAYFLFSSIAPLIQGKILFAASSSEQTNWRSIFTWKTLGPWFALQLWLLLIPALLIGPFLAAYFWLWKVVPVLASHLEASDMSFPYAYQVVIQTMNVIGRFSWVLFLIPASLLFWFSTAKFVSETNQSVPNP